MTVSSELNRKEYAGNGTTTAFATSPVIFFDTSDLEVYDVLDSTGVATLKTITTHYTVSGGAGSTGTVTMLTAPVSGHTLVIVRSLPLTQADDFVQNDASDAEVVEDAFDRQTMVSQQLQARVDRSIRLPDGDVSGANTELPTPAALTVPGWNAAGTALTNYPVQTGTSLVNLAAAGGAALVGWIYAAGSAVAATVQNWISWQEKNVFGFMTVAQIADVQSGANTLDCYAAIVAAQASLPVGTSTNPGGGILKFPTGKYRISAALTHLERVTWKGYGRFSSVLNYVGAGVAFTSPATGNRFMLEDICLRGVDGTGTIGYRFQGDCTNLETKNVRIEGFTVAGLNLTGTANNITLINPEITNCGDAGVNASGGILSNGNANAVTILGGTIGSNNGWGIFSSGITKNWKIYTDIEGNTLGGIRGSGFNGLDICSYLENTAANTYQVRLDAVGGASYTNYGVTIRGCNLGASAAGFDILAIEGTEGLIVEGNHVRSCRRLLDISGGSVTNYRVFGNAPLANVSSGLVWNGTDDNNAQVITDVAPTHSGGTGDGSFTPSGRLGRSITAVGTDADTNQKVLTSVPLPRNTLSADGQAVRVTAWGTTAANGNTKTIRLKLGGTGGQTQAQAAGAYNAQNWKMEVLIIRTGAAAQDTGGCITVGATVAATDVTVGTTSLTADTTIDVTGQNGTAAANDIVCEGMLVEYLP